MTIPNDMRHILALALQDACRLAGCGGEEEIHDAYMAALEWLRAQAEAPVMPEPDWSQAPEWAIWFSIDQDGKRTWWEREPWRDDRFTWWLYRWEEGIHTRHEPVEQRPEKYGIDWRETLRRRPEASE